MHSSFLHVIVMFKFQETLKQSQKVTNSQYKK